MFNLLINKLEIFFNFKKNVLFKILSYIAKIVDENPNLASYYSVGRTYENRELRVLVLKTPTSQKAVWIGNIINKCIILVKIKK